MIVVPDTSPINDLVLIELQDLPPKLFDRILIPEAVHSELQSDAAPDPIKRFLAEGPDWLEVRPSPEIDPALRQLDSVNERHLAGIVYRGGCSASRRTEGSPDRPRTRTSGVWHAWCDTSCCRSRTGHADRCPRPLGDELPRGTAVAQQPSRRRTPRLSLLFRSGLLVV
jgi:hypothetical protein